MKKMKAFFKKYLESLILILAILLLIILVSILESTSTTTKIPNVQIKVKL
jgi:CHASE3 domain sensor protein